MRTLIAIPARYGSTRFPGKPLAKIGGKSMLARVVDIAWHVAAGRDDVDILVTTEDRRIADHADEIGVRYVLTPPTCPTGTDRVLAALRQMPEWPDFVINLQGDAPFTPPGVLDSLMTTFEQNPRLDVVTPVYRMSWAELDELRDAKTRTPFSGTTCVFDKEYNALWFSKQIVPAIRKESDLRAADEQGDDGPSPVYRHLGIYGFRSDVLERFVSLPMGVYEQLEGLEQLRMLENKIRIRAVPVTSAGQMLRGGIDSPEDLDAADALIRQMEARS